ncbi:MAG: tagaturonate reductase [Clostridia bacterium]|nr:tagaturonate reductase [Clostridia bacterium]
MSAKIQRPETVIQFGEGGFLRGFVDWMLQILNNSGEFSGSAVVVQPIQNGMCRILEEQDCIYTHVMRGLKDGVPTVDTCKIDSISRCVNPYDDYEAFLSLADNPSFKVIVSNTTEAGIVYNENDKPDVYPHVTFPAKLTALLYRRFKNNLNGFLILPCELIDKNGQTLKNCVLSYAKLWNLEPEFAEWINTQNAFCNTFVDRIVTGYPKNETFDLGYTDNMLNTSEIFHLWVIEGDSDAVNSVLPFNKTNLNVLITNNLEKYRTRKVRILNGAHTSMIPYALLSGVKTVRECMENKTISRFLHTCVYDEIIPTLDLEREELLEYADCVFERFKNPYIEHMCSSIALNSVSKFKVRVLPSILEYVKRFNKIPENLVFSLYCLIKFYKTGEPNDMPEIVDIMKNSSIKDILSDTKLWDTDISFLYTEVIKYDN